MSCKPSHPANILSPSTMGSTYILHKRQRISHTIPYYGCSWVGNGLVPAYVAGRRRRMPGMADRQRDTHTYICMYVYVCNVYMHAWVVVVVIVGR